jgi:hypothetical protein
LGGLVLNYIPVFNQNPVFDAKYVSYNPVHRLEARKPSVEDYEIFISHNRSWFMLEGWRHASVVVLLVDDIFCCYEADLVDDVL